MGWPLSLSAELPYIYIKSVHIKPHLIFSKNKQLVVCLIWQIEWDSAERKTSTLIDVCTGVQIWPCETPLKFLDTSNQPDIEIVKLFSWIAATVKFSNINRGVQCNFRCCELSFMSSVAAKKEWVSPVPTLSACPGQISWASQAPQEACAQETESHPGRCSGAGVNCSTGMNDCTHSNRNLNS